LDGIPYLYYVIKIKSMNKVNTKSVSKSLPSHGDEMFFRGQHPDTRSPKEWVKYMNKKYPHLKWNGKEGKDS
jgi:hypothetical protein